MTTINRRIIAMYRAWYQPDVYMSTEDWLCIGYLVIAGNFGFALGLLIGLAIC